MGTLPVTTRAPSGRVRHCASPLAAARTSRPPSYLRPPAAAASLAAEAGIAVFKVAFELWVHDTERRSLSHQMRASLDQLRAVTAGSGAARPRSTASSRGRRGKRRPGSTRDPMGVKRRPLEISRAAPVWTRQSERAGQRHPRVPTAAFGRTSSARPRATTDSRGLPLHAHGVPPRPLLRSLRRRRRQHHARLLGGLVQLVSERVLDRRNEPPTWVHSRESAPSSFLARYDPGGR